MRVASAFLGVLLLGAVSRPRAVAAPAPAQQIVDRIAARIEDDIITLSEVRELAAYQQLIDNRVEPDDRLLSELIEQWVINNEATASYFPAPAASEVDREIARIEGRFPSPQAYQERLAALGLSQDAVRRMVTREIYLARYLDYKFRPSVQISEDDIAKYYQQELGPALTAKGEKIPALNTVSDQIREVLVQKGIDDRAASWLDQTKSRLKIEIEAAANAPASVMSDSAPAMSVQP